MRLRLCFRQRHTSSASSIAAYVKAVILHSHHSHGRKFGGGLTANRTLPVKSTAAKRTSRDFGLAFCCLCSLSMLFPLPAWAVVGECIAISALIVATLLRPGGLLRS